MTPSSAPEPNDRGTPSGNGLVGAGGIDARLDKRVARLEGTLGSLRAQARAQLLLTRVAVVIAGVAGATLVAGTLDYALRFPAEIRWVLWVVGVASLGFALKRHVVPIAKFKPSLTEMALRVERISEEAKGTRGVRASRGGANRSSVLASAIELAQDASPETGPESRRVAASLLDSIGTLPGASRVLDPKRLMRAMGALVLVLVPMGAIAFTMPELSRIGAQRVLTPWAGAQWPKRTHVVDATGVAAHPLTKALPLRAIVERRGGSLGSGSFRTNSFRARDEEVRVTYRVLADGAAPTADRTAVLTPQDREARVKDVEGGGEVAAGTVGDSEVGGLEGSPSNALVRGELHERLLDVSMLTPPGWDAKRAERGLILEYRFATRDDQTPWQRVALVQPPTLVEAKAMVTLPTYAKDVAPAMFVRGLMNLGDGRDARGSLGPILAGSRVELSLELNRAVPTSASGGVSLALDQDQGVALVLRTLPGIEAADVESVEIVGPTTWRFVLMPKESRRAQLVLTDANGIASDDESVLRFEVAADRPPTAAIAAPAQDEFVLATARLVIEADTRDDVALQDVRLDAAVARPPTDSAGAPAEPIGEAVSLARQTFAASANGSPGTLEVALDRSMVRLASTLVMEAIDARPGDQVRVVALATDMLGATAVSPVRTLRVITESELFEQVQRELAGVRQAAQRLEREQGALAASREAAEATPTEASKQANAQDAIARRVEPLKGITDRLSKRLEKNRPSDTAMAGVLNDAAELIDEAREAADQAAQALDQLAKAPEAEKQANANAAEKAQAKAQDALTELAQMLEEGQESWAVRRALERLVTEQRQLQSQTAAAQAQTQGKSPEELTEQQRADQERLAQRQEQLADRALAAINELERKADALQKADTAQAETMRDAALQARKAQVAEKQREAAEQIQQNQNAAAQENQEQAAKALEQAIAELDKQQKRRDEALRRFLADAMQVLDTLIARQAAELMALGQAAGGMRVVAGLDVAMIDLNRATLALGDRVEAEQSAGPKLAELLDAASQAQGDAIAALRLATPDLAEADEHERTSLARLREAKLQAEKQDEQAEERDVERERAQLRDAYRKALDEATGIQGQTTPLVVREPLDRELTRRERAQARQLAEASATLRATLEKLRADTSELTEAGLFAFAHQRLDADLAASAATLGQGQVTRGVLAKQAAVVRVLAALAKALDNADNPEDEFREDEGSGAGGGGGGGGGSPPLVPPVAELKLLRLMQQEALDRTRAVAGVDEAGGVDGVGGGDTIESVAALQRSLAEKGKELIDRLSQQGGGEGGGPEVPAGDEAGDEAGAGAGDGDEVGPNEPLLPSAAAPRAKKALRMR